MDKLTIPKDVAVKILMSAAALVNEDRDEAYHHLYTIADPTFKYMDNPWKDLEAIAGVALNDLAKDMLKIKTNNNG